MKQLMRYLFIIGILLSLYKYGDRLVMNIDYQMISNSALLIQYGVMIGYYLLVIFIVAIQVSNYRQLISHKPIFGRSLMFLYHALAIVFLILVLFDYEFQRTLTLLMLFMSASIIFELIRDRFLQQYESNLKHPKKIY